MAKLTVSVAKRIARDELGVPDCQSPQRTDRMWFALFGLSPFFVVFLWNLIDQTVAPLNNFNHVRYFLLSLMFLKTYNTMDFLAAMLDIDSGTAAHWIWQFVWYIANLNLVRTETSIVSVAKEERQIVY